MNKENKNLEKTTLNVEYTIKGLSDLYKLGEIQFNSDLEDGEVMAYHVLTGQLTPNPLGGWTDGYNDDIDSWELLESIGFSATVQDKCGGLTSDDENKGVSLFSVCISIDEIVENPEDESKTVKFVISSEMSEYHGKYSIQDGQETWDLPDDSDGFVYNSGVGGVCLSYFNFDYMRNYIRGAESIDIHNEITVFQCVFVVDSVEMGYTEDQYYQMGKNQAIERYDTLHDEIREEIGKNYQFFEVVANIVGEKFDPDLLEFSENPGLKAIYDLNRLYTDAEVFPDEFTDLVSWDVLSRVNDEIEQFLKVFRKYGGSNMNLFKFAQWVEEDNPLETLNSAIDEIGNYENAKVNEYMEIEL